MKDNKLRLTIITGWLGMLLLQIMMQITDTLEGFLSGDYSFANHLGTKGIWACSILAIVAIVTMLLTATFSDKKIKTIVLVLSVIFTLYMFVHQIMHLVGGDRFDIHFNFDVLHHICGIWASIHAYKWIKLEE